MDFIVKALASQLKNANASNASKWYNLALVVLSDSKEMTKTFKDEQFTQGLPSRKNNEVTSKESYDKEHEGCSKYTLQLEESEGQFSIRG
jgi:hypothetical protein